MVAPGMPALLMIFKETLFRCYLNSSGSSVFYQEEIICFIVH
jgi:hypothetical protein